MIIIIIIWSSLVIVDWDNKKKDLCQTNQPMPTSFLMQLYFISLLVLTTIIIVIIMIIILRYLSVLSSCSMPGWGWRCACNVMMRDVSSTNQLHINYIIIITTIMIIITIIITTTIMIISTELLFRVWLARSRSSASFLARRSWRLFFLTWVMIMINEMMMVMVTMVMIFVMPSIMFVITSRFLASWLSTVSVRIA